MTAIEYLGEWPAEARAAIEPHVTATSWLVPPWCHCLAFRWDSSPNESDDSMSCHANYAYRWASIRVHPGWLDTPEWDRRQAVIHELLHVFLAPLANYAECEIDRLLKDEAPKYHGSVRAELTDRLEGAIQDLATVLRDREGAVNQEKAA